VFAVLSRARGAMWAFLTPVSPDTHAERVQAEIDAMPPLTGKKRPSFAPKTALERQHAFRERAKAAKAAAAAAAAAAVREDEEPTAARHDAAGDGARGGDDVPPHVRTPHAQNGDHIQGGDAASAPPATEGSAGGSGGGGDEGRSGAASTPSASTPSASTPSAGCSTSGGSTANTSSAAGPSSAPKPKPPPPPKMTGASFRKGAVAKPGKGKSAVARPGGSRKWSDAERLVVHQYFDRYRGPGIKPDYSRVATMLQTSKETKDQFGPDSPAGGIKRQGVRTKICPFP